jgi:hypothetical protein
LVGGDLPESDGGGGVRTRDADECQMECNRRANCQYWSHVAEWRVGCYLKSEAGDERKLDGSITGWKGDGCGVAENVPLVSLEAGLLDADGCMLDNIAILLRSFVECRQACRDQVGKLETQSNILLILPR